jgi:hypothetical protein
MSRKLILFTPSDKSASPFGISKRASARLLSGRGRSEVALLSEKNFFFAGSLFSGNCQARLCGFSAEMINTKRLRAEQPRHYDSQHKSKQSTEAEAIKIDLWHGRSDSRVSSLRKGVSNLKLAHQLTSSSSLRHCKPTHKKDSHRKHLSHSNR